MALFRTDPASGLAKAQTALTAIEARQAELEAERLTALGETDAIEPVTVIDGQLAEQRRRAAILNDRIRVLRAAVREQERTALEKARTAAIAKSD